MAKHVFIQQQMNGIPFANAVANVALNNDDKVVVFGNCFVKPSELLISDNHRSQCLTIYLQPKWRPARLQ